jgi:competence protein ComEA
MLLGTAVLVAWIGQPLAERQAEPQALPQPTGHVSPPPPSVAPARPAARTSEPARTTARAVRLDINRASVEELQTLPGIGAVLAQRIVERRAARPFQTVGQLRSVKGIGAKRFARLQSRVTVGPVRNADPSGPRQPKEAL